MSGWQAYDPTWLVELARKEEPDKAWLAEALAKCTRCKKESEAYIYFVDPETPEWQHDDSIDMEHPTEGMVVIDVLKKRRIGGIELVDKILS